MNSSEVGHATETEMIKQVSIIPYSIATILL